MGLRIGARKREKKKKNELEYCEGKAECDGVCVRVE